jgi:lysozyme
MILGDAGRALIESFETCKLYAYQDQRGIWTIGWGHTMGVVPYLTCTQADADAWFVQDTQAAVNAVMRSLDVAVNQNQFDALVSFTFNVGAGSEAHSTLLSLVNQGKFALAAAQFSFWNHVNGVPNAGLTRRRAAEQALFSGTSTADSPPGP